MYISIRCRLSYDCHTIDRPLQLFQPYLQVVCVCVCWQGLEEVSRTDIGKKIKEGMEEAAKTAKTSAESVSKSGEKLGKTGAFKAISQVWGRCAQIMHMYVLVYQKLNCVCWFLFLSNKVRIISSSLTKSFQRVS